MSDLPLIDNPNPFTVPAKAEVTYDKDYIVNLTLDTIDNNGFNQPITVTFRPYNPDLQLVYDKTQNNNIDCDRVVCFGNVWQLKDQYPMVGQVVGGLILVCKALDALPRIDSALTQLAAAIQYANARLANLDARIGNGDDEMPMEELITDKAAVEASLTPLTEQQTALTAQRQQILAGLGVS